jgi:hypothetical protein
LAFAGESVSQPVSSRPHAGTDAGTATTAAAAAAAAAAAGGGGATAAAGPQSPGSLPPLLLLRPLPPPHAPHPATLCFPLQAPSSAAQAPQSLLLASQSLAAPPQMHCLHGCLLLVLPLLLLQLVGVGMLPHCWDRVAQGTPPNPHLALLLWPPLAPARAVAGCSQRRKSRGAAACCCRRRLLLCCRCVGL